MLYIHPKKKPCVGFALCRVTNNNVYIISCFVQLSTTTEMLLKVYIFVVGVLEISSAGFSRGEKKMFTPLHDTSEVLLGTEMFFCLQQKLPTLLVLRANKVAVMAKYRTTRLGWI